MKSQAFRVPGFNTNQPRAASGGAAAHSFGPALAASRTKRPATARDQLSAQRVMLRIHANIHVALHGKKSTFQVTTLSVNRDGALVVMERALPLDTRLVLEHSQTKECVACRVTHPSREMPEGFHVPIEFDPPAPDFWKIAFPPCD